jgi:DNA-binding LytR/AlgR family response regulator
MKDFEKELSEEKFLRIHKSYIVTLDKIERFSSRTVEIGDSKIPLSRNQKSQLSDALKLLEN